MSKNIPIALQEHLDEPVNTTCFLIRITPNAGFFAAPLPIIGLSSLDVDVAYDDGDGEVIYSALAGGLPSSIATSDDLSVDNAEVETLIPAYELGPVIESDINAGRYDSAEYVLYRVNYKDLSMGHEIMMAGTIGQAKVIGGLSCFLELRSLTNQYKQTVCERDSLTCRATFGSTSDTERFPCNYDISGLWSDGEVTAVGDEPDREFTDGAIFNPTGYYVPGIVQWLTGNNAGRSYEVESQVLDTVSFSHQTAFDIQVGDTFKIRKDCGKRFREDCVAIWNNGLNFRGEPDIPVGDESTLQAPGAGVPGPNLPYFGT